MLRQKYSSRNGSRRNNGRMARPFCILSLIHHENGSGWRFRRGRENKYEKADFGETWIYPAESSRRHERLRSADMLTEHPIDVNGCGCHRTDAGSVGKASLR
jgi:hypothetical protein